MSRMAKLSDVLAASEGMSSDASLEKRKAFRVVWSVTAEDAASTGSLYHAQWEPRLSSLLHRFFVLAHLRLHNIC